MLDKLKSIGYTLFFFYVMISFFSGLYFYGQSRYQCIQEVGFFKGFFVGCDILQGNFGPARAPGFMGSQFKGFLWPYHAFSKSGPSETEILSSNDSLPQLAQRLIDSQNARVGEALDEHTTFQYAEMVDNTLIFNYEITDQLYEPSSLFQRRFTQFMTKNLCKNDGSLFSKTVLLLIDDGYKIQSNYSNSKGETLQVIVDSCAT